MRFADSHSTIENRPSKIRLTPWCNGNTAPFGGVILGSNPSGVATPRKRLAPNVADTDTTECGQASYAVTLAGLRESSVRNSGRYLRRGRVRRSGCAP